MIFIFKKVRTCFVVVVCLFVCFWFVCFCCLFFVVVVFVCLFCVYSLYMCFFISRLFQFHKDVLKIQCE